VPASRPALSVVMATTGPWPQARVALDSVYDQACACDAEILVADGSRGGSPPESHPRVRWLHRPGATVFELRSLGLRAAEGEVVALTEDHCRVAPDWCAAVLRAHREHPRAAVIGGALENGAPDSLVDWASFLVSNGPFLPPLANGPADRVTGQANASYKRWALAEYPPDALDEGDYRRRLAAAGHTLVLDDRLRVAHVQSLGLAGTCAIHFHDGRCVVGTRRRWSSRWRLGLDLLKGVLLPARVVVATGRVVGRTIARRADLRRIAVLSAPCTLLVVGAHSVGELAGLVAGPGESPRRMR
jgi:Glycosyl transferase family 2